MEQRTVIIGAGVAGLSAAIELAAQGRAVTVFEKASYAGGKMRQIHAGDALIDAGPTVLTMRWVFEELFNRAGKTFEEYCQTKPAELLARHAWSPEERLDLHAATKSTAEAIGEFAGPREARAFMSFARESASIYRVLKDTYITASRPSVNQLVRRAGLGALGDLWDVKPFVTAWRALSRRFKDPRLRQLFGRYTTYCGGSPFKSPATLMLVAHVESEGVWLVDGGMAALSRALSHCAGELGADIRLGVGVERIVTQGGRAAGVVTGDGGHHGADAVIANSDVNAIAAGLFGEAITGAVDPVPARRRSLSAVTWAMHATTGGFPLCRHNVFFSNAYREEFEDIFERDRLPGAPTVYVCAQDRDDQGNFAGCGAERLLCLVNAPPIGDRHTFSKSEIDVCETRMIDRLARCGLKVARNSNRTRVTSPTDFEALFPGSGGALYGRAPHGWTASFQRHGARSRLPGLYLAGGGVHPGPGVPMAALSGRLAAQALMADLTSR